MVFLFGVYALSTTKIGEGIVTTTVAYSEGKLYDGALEIAKKSIELQELLGDIEPLDNLAILEGTTIFSNNNNTVKTSVRIKGSKSNGKLDISAERNGAVWNYKEINVRIKEPKQTILVLKDEVD
ncbi:cytochrome c oxidase assembly factor Coa1 family protein [Mariniflexile sp. AS56]|nr:cytochrome c oxidase assembly factor Coa1 family protein [Mariniflexile sp. AS56]